MALSQNSVNLAGYLGNDPEIRTTKGGTEEATISVGISYQIKDQSGNYVDKTEWVRCRAYKGKAKYISYLRKGSSICLTGSIHTDSWQDNSSQSKYMTYVLVSSVSTADKKNGSQDSQQQTQKQNTLTTINSYRSAKNGNQSYTNQPDAGFDDDEMPF